MAIEIVVTFDLDPVLVDRIATVDAALDVRTLGIGTRERFGARLPYPMELQPLTPPGEITTALRTAEVLFSAWAGPLPNLRLREAAPELRWVQLSHAGIERVDIGLSTGVTFTTVGGMSAGLIAEWTIGTMLMFAKGWPQAFRAQQAHEYRRYMPHELAGSAVGIIGLGTIGSEVARRARALGCRTLGMRRSFRSRGPHELVDEAVPPGDLDYLLGASDYVVLSAPATAQTRSLIDADALRAMQSAAVLINVARGTLIDENALIEALRTNAIRGAALDVYAQEPLATDSPLWNLPNAILSPHIAAGTDRYYERATEIFCENLGRYLRHEPLLNVVDLARGY